MGTLITGAAGYVGSCILKRHGDEGYFRNVYMPSIEELDLADYPAVDRFFGENHIDRVLHLAAWLDNGDINNIFNSNIVAVYNLLRVCEKYHIRHFVFISTNNVYGDGHGEILSENAARRPLIGNNYGLSKYCGELLVEDMLSDSDIRYAIIRLGDIYGPKKKSCALIKAVTNNIKENRPQALYGTGDRIRDYIFIDDVADGISHIVNQEIVGKYNLATGVGTSVREIIQIAEGISACKETTKHVDVEKEDHTKVIMNIDSIGKTGFFPHIGIEEGLRRIVSEEMKNE